MTTFIIWNECPEKIKFGSVPFRADHLQGKYINDSETSDTEESEINLVHSQATWYPDLQSWGEAIRALPALENLYIVEIGFIL